MNTQNLIQEILDELFTIDPDLKKYQKELEVTMAKMIANKPDDKFDENFRQELKMKLLARAEELERAAASRPALWKNLIFWRGLAFATAAIALAVLAIVPAVKNGWIGVPKFGTENPLAYFSGNIKIENVGDRAFGDLGAATQNVLEENLSRATSSVSSPTESAAPSGDSLAESSSGTSQPAIGFGGGGGAVGARALDAKMMPPQYMTKYNYVYVGDDFSFLDESVTVLRREKSFGNEDLSSILGKINFGLFDASKLSNVKVQTLSLAEDRDGGYVVDFNSYEGIISVYQNWQRTMPVDYNSLPRLVETDIPTDEKLIEIARGFMAKYGIDLSNYGEPKVNKNWRLGLVGVPAADIWVPDEMTVQYPLVIDGKEVWEQGGYEHAGFSVNVNIRTMKVTGLYGLAAQNYQSSNYAAETDTNRLMKFALQGDLWPQPTYPEESFNVKEAEVKLGTPGIQYMRYWKYEGNQSSELFVPALVFPILEVTPADESFYKSAVVIPLVKDILDGVERENGNVSPPTILKSEPVAEPAAQERR